MNVSSIGPYAGTANPTSGKSPAFTAIVDYFFNTAKPLSNLDGPAPFRAITIDPNPTATLVEKAFADIQGTGHLDAVAGFEQPSAGIYWYEYPASGKLTDKWNKHPIVTTGNAYEDMLPLDVNKDGAVDIVASYQSPGSSTYNVVWFANPRGRGGNPATDPWPMTLIGAGEGENNLILADIDGDGKIDVVTAHHIYFQNSPTSWTAVQYNSAFRGVALLDIGSGKGPINLVSTNSALNAVWFENPRESGGNARTGKWIMHNVGAGYPCNSTDCPHGDDYVAAYGNGDINGDGRMDIIMAQSEGPGGGIAPPPGGMVWFEAPGDRRNGTWTRHTIDAHFVDAHCIRVADMDHNGTLDLVVSEQDQSLFRRVSVFYNDGAGNFTQEIISNAEGHQTTIGDVQGTGEIDILNSGHGFFGDPHPLQLFLNPVK
ncbi:MAG TPA: VCBS repeat-containing protein [Lacipirellulaceae bacterium]|nr:VCBS repeat-containing protein [Lacipirellulaceae bacterium]